MQTKKNNQVGSTLMAMLFFVVAVSILVSAMVTLIQRQHIFTARSQTWGSEIPVAEAGVEEAMAHLNSRPIPMWTNGWSLLGTNVTKTRTLVTNAGIADCYFYTTISTVKPPRIVSVGFGRIPLQTNYTQRTVAALTRENPPHFGIKVKRTVTMSGSGSDWPFVDSFDSGDPNYSIPPSLLNPGGYNVLERKDTAGIATLSTVPGAINTGSGEIWGYASTPPGGSVIGNVGDGNWNLTSIGLQPGHVRDDFNGTITNAVLPTTTWVAFPATAVLANKDYKLTGNLTSGFKVSSKARLWVTGDVSMTGAGDQIELMPGATLTVYIQGSSAKFGGQGIVNNTGVSTACTVIGLPTCTDFKYVGGVDFVGSLYAPNAAVVIGGGVGVMGAVTADTLSLSGSSGIHYDEALGKNNGPAYTIIRWEEL